MDVKQQLVVIRHGRTSWNAEGRFQGHADIPLDATGELQAKEMAVEVAPLAPSLVLSSDLLRAQATAAALVAATGAALRLDPALREVDLGEWEGLDRAEAAARFPDEYRDWAAGIPVRRGGGESDEEAGARAAAAITATMAQLDPADPITVAVVAHGIVLRATMAALAAAGSIELDGSSPHLDNGAWRAFAYGPATPS
jgi:glucosyl-3-phosphoglycerate phosphatase